MSSIKFRALLLSGALRLNLVGVSKHWLDFQFRAQPVSLKIIKHLYLGSQEGRVLCFAVRLRTLYQVPPGLLSRKRASGAARWARCWHKMLAEARLTSVVSVGLLEELLMLFGFGSRQTEVCLQGVEAAGASRPVCPSSVVFCQLQELHISPGMVTGFLV